MSNDEVKKNRNSSFGVLHSKFEPDFEMMNAEFLMSNAEVTKIEIHYFAFCILNLRRIEMMNAEFLMSNIE